MPVCDRAVAIRRAFSYANAVARSPYDHDTDRELRRRAKAELRNRIQTLRDTYPAASLDRHSHEITERLLARPEWAAARTVALFRSIGSEVRSHELIEAACNAAKTVALPVVVRRGEPLAFRDAFARDPRGEWERSAFGIDEPARDCPRVEIVSVDLWVVPAIAVDPSGHRIGYGGGFYDRTLALARPGAPRIIVAFAFQLVVEVPATETDVACDMVVTERECLPCR